MPEVESRVGAKSVDEILTEFDRRKDELTDLSSATERLIRTILKEEHISFQSVQARVKGREKLRFKYCRPEKDYKCLDDLSDLVGLRIITYYSDTIDRIVDVIAREFGLCSPPEDKRNGDATSFGYSAVHLDCTYITSRLERTEYKRFVNARFEIQITTILGHAWAEMHHPWYDELNSPAEELRRFHRLAAVLELAEQEFLEIRRKKEERNRVASVRVAANAPEIQITLESLNAYIAESRRVVKLDTELERVLGNSEAVLATSHFLNSVSKVLKGVGICTIQSLRDELEGKGNAIVEYARRCLKIWDPLYIDDTDRTYARGLCVFMLASLLASLQGKERYDSLMSDAGLSFHPDLDEEAQLSIARDVAATFGFH